MMRVTHTVTVSNTEGHELESHQWESEFSDFSLLI